MYQLEIINRQLLDEVSGMANASPRLRMNYNFHQALDDKCHRFLNAVEPGTIVPVHRHPTKDETFVLIRGKVRVCIFDDSGEEVNCCELNCNEGRYGVNIPKGIWHSLESLESGSCIFEVKEGPYVPHEEEGIMLRSEK